MARGLSVLQKNILLLALRNRLEGHTTNSNPNVRSDLYHCDLYTFEIMAFHWGWESRGELIPGDQLFSKASIGAAYNKAHASLSRATRRLADRWLVECYRGVCGWSAVNLTERGLEVAAKLARNNTCFSDNSKV